MLIWSCISLVSTVYTQGCDSTIAFLVRSLAYTRHYMRWLKPSSFVCIPKLSFYTNPRIMHCQWKSCVTICRNFLLGCLILSHCRAGGGSPPNLMRSPLAALLPTHPHFFVLLLTLILYLYYCLIFSQFRLDVFLLLSPYLSNLYFLLLFVYSEIVSQKLNVFSVHDNLCLCC